MSGMVLQCAPCDLWAWSGHACAVTTAEHSVSMPLTMHPPSPRAVRGRLDGAKMEFNRLVNEIKQLRKVG